jgi:hypothetical protein
MTVRVQDALGNPIPSATIDVVHDNSGELGDPPTEQVADDLSMAPDGEHTFFDLAVNGDDPEGTPVIYTVTATADDHDLTDRTATAAVVAGGAPVVVITLPEYGSITGAVVGRVPGQRDAALRVGPRLHIVATRVDGNGDPVGEPPLAVRVDPDNDDGFAVSGPPGFYTIDVSHDDFEPFDPPEVPPGDAVLGGKQVYQMSNIDPRDDPPGQPDVPNAVGTWALRAKSGSLDLTVHEDTLTGPNVPDATITLAGPNDPSQLVDLTTGNLVEDPRDTSGSPVSSRVTTCSRSASSTPARTCPSR